MLKIVLCAGAVTGLALVACRSARSAPTAQELVEEGAAHMAEVLERVVSDEERAARAHAISASYREVERSYFESLNAHRRRLRELNADHAAPRERFDEIFAACNAERRAFKDETVAAFTALREHLEPAEWTAVFDSMREMDEKWLELAQ